MPPADVHPRPTLLSAITTRIFRPFPPNSPSSISATARSASSASEKVTYPTPLDLDDSLSVATKPWRTGPMNEKWVSRSVVVAS